jgi:hypothetical protein
VVYSPGHAHSVPLTKHRLQTRSAQTSIFVILCACVCAPAQAEQPAPPQQHDVPGAIGCSLVNGDRISGKVGDVSPAAISLATELLETLTVPRAAVPSCQAKDGEPQLSLLFLEAVGVAPAAGNGGRGRNSTQPSMPRRGRSRRRRRPLRGALTRLSYRVCSSKSRPPPSASMPTARMTAGSVTQPFLRGRALQHPARERVGRLGGRISAGGRRHLARGREARPQGVEAEGSLPSPFSGRDSDLQGQGTLSR